MLNKHARREEDSIARVPGNADIERSLVPLLIDQKNARSSLKASHALALGFTALLLQRRLIHKSQQLFEEKAFKMSENKRLKLQQH